MLRKLSGQIMPFLLVIIAVFLGAYFTTFQIGSQAINMTCSDNAADACSLAAASHSARLLNTIHLGNRFRFNAFDDFRADIQGKCTAMRHKLISAKNDIAHAKAKLASAKALAAPGAFCTVWNSALSASNVLAQAADLVQSARNSVSALPAMAASLQNRVQHFKNVSKNNFCDQLSEANDSRDAAKKDGVKYALMNNCVFPTLPPGDQTALQNQIDASPRENNNPRYDFTYDWHDSAGDSRSMSANVTLPKIASYELEVLKMNQPCGPRNMPEGLSSAGEDRYGMSSYSRLGILLAPIAGNLMGDIGEEVGIYTASQDALVSTCPPLASSPTGHCCSGNFSALAGRADAVTARIDSYLSDLDTASAAIDSLIQHTIDIAKDLARKPGKRIVSVRNCDGAEGVIILGVDDIKFESGCIKCNVNMSNSGGSSSGNSISSFGGGSFSPTHPNQHYIPQISNTADDSCPNNGGVTVGSTTDFSHSDGGCN